MIDWSTSLGALPQRERGEVDGRSSLSRCHVFFAYGHLTSSCKWSSCRSCSISNFKCQQSSVSWPAALLQWQYLSTSHPKCFLSFQEDSYQVLLLSFRQTYRVRGKQRGLLFSFTFTRSPVIMPCPIDFLPFNLPSSPDSLLYGHDVGNHDVVEVEISKILSQKPKESI